MATAKSPATILLISSNTTLHTASRSELSDSKDFKLLDQTVIVENFFSYINDLQPDIILLDFQFHPQPLNLIDRITMQFPNVPLVTILTQSELDYVDQIMLSGARTFIQYPYKSGKLKVTLTRVVQLKERLLNNPPKAAEKEKPSQSQYTYCVFSPKGGTGTTTVAINLAISLHNTLTEKVLLVDGKHLFGHISLYLNLRTGNSITDLIVNADSLDERLVNQVVVKHVSGIHVLPSPNSVYQAQSIYPESLFKVVQVLQKIYPYIVIDGGNHIDDNTVTYLDSSDKTLLVLNPDIASMRDARQYLELSDSLSYAKEKTLLIVNMVGRKAEIKPKEIEKILKMTIFGTIPVDEKFALSSLNEGVPILQLNSRHQISRAYNRITKDLINLQQ